MEKKLAAAVRKVSGRDKVTALGEKDLVLALGSASAGDETVGTLPYTGKDKDPIVGVAKPIDGQGCPHVEYPASA